MWVVTSKREDMPEMEKNMIVACSIYPLSMGVSTQWYATPTMVVVTLKTLEIAKTSDTTFSSSVSLGQLCCHRYITQRAKEEEELWSLLGAGVNRVYVHRTS